MSANIHCNFRRQKWVKGRECLKCKDLTTAYVECKNKSDSSNNSGNWNNFKILISGFAILMKSAVFWAVTRRLVVITTRRRVITQKTTDFNFKIIQKIPEQHRESMESRNYRTQPYWHCTRTAGSTDVKVQIVYHGK